MILVRRRPFSISRYHVRERPSAETDPVAQGPILRVRIRFEHWFKERRLEADAFVDPGADVTSFSARWVQEQGGIKRRARPRCEVPDLDNPEHFRIVEAATIDIEGVELSLGDDIRITPFTKTQGYEDILLGRDFLAAHKLLLLIDGQETTFSLLRPVDEDNQRRRRRILDEFDGHVGLLEVHNSHQTIGGPKGPAQ